MNPRLVRLFSWLVALGGAALFIALLLRVVERASDVTWWLNYAYPREGSEGLTMYEALLTRLGENIYALPTPTRFISAPYPPIYYYLSGLFLDSNAPAFMPGRWLSLFAAIVAALIVGLLAAMGITQNSKFKLQNYLTPFVLGILLFATSYPNIIWAARFRADMLALALMVGGLLALQLCPRGAGAWLAAVLFALAFYTKQTALAGPLAAGMYLLLLAWRTRRTKRGEALLASTTLGRGVTFRWAFIWIAVLAALFILPTLLLTALLGGYWAKLVTYHALPFSGRTLLNLLGALWENHWPLIIAAMGYLALALTDLRRGRTITIVTPYLLAATLLLPTGGVVGADSNHLLAICFALVLAAAQLAGRLALALQQGMINHAPTGEGAGGAQFIVPVAPAALALLLLLAAYLFTSAQPAGWYGLDLRRPSEAEQGQLARIVNNVRQNPGTSFLSDEVGLLVLAGKRPAYDDLFDLTALANLGKWDDTALRQQVQNRAFALILLHNRVEELRGDILTDAMRKAIADNYKLLFPDVWYTYVPK